MSFGREEAQRVKKSQEDARKAQRLQLEANTILVRESPRLWELLVNTVKKEVEEFVAELPSSGLRVQRLNDANLTIDRPVQPIIRLELIYHPGQYSVTVTIRRQQPAPAADTEQTYAIHMLVPSNPQITFFGSDRYLSAQEATTQVLTEVFRFFRTI